MLTDKDKELIAKIKAMSDANISQRIFWGKIFLYLSAGAAVTFVINLLVNEPEAARQGREIFLLVILAAFTLGYGSLTIGKLLGVIKRRTD